ncbi:hypothetical protein JCM10212_006149 [Sporobolomyces blumeae]
MSNPARPPTSSFLSTAIPPYGAPSRSPSNVDEEESADDSDFIDDPDASTASLNKLGPATPKPSTATNWPFSALTASTSGSHHVAGTFPDGHPQAQAGRSMPARTTSTRRLSRPTDAMDQDADRSSTTDDGEGSDVAFGDDSYAPPAIPASSLPHEILLHILRLLPPTALAPALRVCKAWCQCGVELLWHKPMFTSLSALYRMLQVLSLPDQTFPYPEFVRRINFSNLTDEMSDKMLNKLMPCTRIERLTLTGCKNLSSAGMVALLEQTTQLVALDLSEVDAVDNDVVSTLAEHCPRLQGLNLTGCGSVSDVGMEKLALGCPALRRIKLRKCDLITDVSLVLLSLHCPLLLEVDLGLCFGISSTSLQQLLRTSHNLRELCLNGCSSLTDDGFPDPSTLSLPLQHSSSYSSTQASPLPSGSTVSSADPSRASSPGPDPLKAPSGTMVRRPPPLNSPPALHAFDHLRYLDLTSLTLLTDQAVAGIVKFMPKIRNLILAKCSRLTDESLYSICSVGKHLHYLHLGHVNSITDKAVTAVARSCTRLRYIDLACCNNLTDVSVLELAANLPRLKRIGLVRVTNITDESLNSLHARTSLERIHLSYCDNLTVAGVNDLLQHLPRLTHLSLTGVQAFRKKVLQVFCRPPPKDFNDHQRRSFCVFSGRGVHDLRRYLRSLSPFELESLAHPDPPSDDEALRRHMAFNMGPTQAQLQAQAQLAQTRIQQAQALIQQAGGRPGGGPAAGGGGPGTPGGGAGAGAAPPAGSGATVQLAHARARLAQLAQARQAMSFAHAAQGPVAGSTAPGGAAPGGSDRLASAFDPASSSTGSVGPDQPGNLRVTLSSVDVQGRPIASSSRSAPLPTYSLNPASSRSFIGSQTVDPATSAASGARPQMPSLYRQNSLGLMQNGAGAGPSDGRGAGFGESDTDDLEFEEEQSRQIPIRAVPSTSTSARMDVDDSASSDSNAPRVRSRRDTVTRTNYRTPPARRHGGGYGGNGDDEDDERGEATGEEEDLTMGDA